MNSLYSKALTCTQQFWIHSMVSGKEWPCPALFIKLLVFLLLIKDSLTLTGRLSVLVGVQPPFLYREMTFFIWSCIFYNHCLSISALCVIYGIFCHISTRINLSDSQRQVWDNLKEFKWEINTKSILCTTEYIMMN